MERKIKFGALSGKLFGCDVDVLEKRAAKWTSEPRNNNHDKSDNNNLTRLDDSQQVQV